MASNTHPSGASDDDRDWRRDAACRDLDVSVFYHPDNERGYDLLRRDRDAKAICARCRVRRACLAEALAAPERYGVWGGLTPEERERLSMTLGGHPAT